ncbi:hypothetical protein FQN55_001328 [Onygenales sp. PD_40]|nr:hypothetical protein FQN55_001328 [Onygenales sp. PD_40]KAK2778441.1 hypothetical protein FQN52_002737 [Onygenales sp. PD_12]KAK2781346.1 hypothetical protein FQN53_000624 [Emmonsiellopsis sp. PD_33]KAK2800063.1 hypothetical protein FQN51_006302 [Onygenales sp. PD_10]
MVTRKRAREDAEDTAFRASSRSVQPPVQKQDEEHGGLLNQLRNMWEFSNLMQYIYSFGKVVKINDDIDIEDLETECLKPGASDKLLDIGLTLLKFVSSHRGLTYENFEEYTRRQYNAKAPGRNPFGDAEQPIKFNDLDVFQRIRILQQLTVWTFWNPDRIRERMPEQKETDQTQWRVHEIGYDRDERLYYVLDDNRLYRRTDPPIPPPRAAKPKANSKKARAAARAAKKRKLSEVQDEEDEESKADVNGDVEHDSSQGYKWECVAITLAQYQEFLEKIKKSKDPNEQYLRDRLVEDVLPIIEKVEESHRKKIMQRERDLINMERLAHAKRSSRIAGKHERERQEMEAAEEAKRREAERIALIKEQEKQKKIEKERLYRMMTREQRLKDRDEKRRLHEEELARIAEEAKKIENGEARLSERQLKAEMDKRKKDLEALQNEDQWIFDCSGCGVHGENLDDGSHIVACEKCNVWQHSKCLGIAQNEAEKDDFHFICSDCKRRVEEANRPKIPPLKFRIGPSASPPSNSRPAVNGEKRKREDASVSPSVKKTKRPSTSPAQPGTLPPPHPSTNGYLAALGQGQHIPPPQANAFYQPGMPSSPQRQRQPQPMQNGFYPPPSALQRTSNPPQTGSALAPSPLPLNPPANTFPRGPAQPSGHAQFFHYQPPAALPNSNASSFNSQRPSSSHSAQGSFISPIQNRPAMSPTQGNRDVGPLAGFPPSALPNGALPATPHVHNQAYHTTSTSPYALPQSSNPSRPLSFSSTAAATPARNSFAHTPPPHYSQSQGGPPMSGLSPTKHSPAPAHPLSFGSTGSTTAPILPPVQRLQPSPKLMGRSSPDAPIPAPVKSMTPEQEDRRRRENELSALNLGQSQNLNSNARPQVLDAGAQPQFPPMQQQHTQGQGQDAPAITKAQPTLAPNGQ